MLISFAVEERIDVGTMNINVGRGAVGGDDSYCRDRSMTRRLAL
jgi:hypothetical protein